MGALDIRPSSANLNPLGSFRMPELNTGAAAAFTAQARAAQAAADAAGVRGRAAMEGILRRGDIVSDTLSGLGKIAIDLFNRENNRIATNAILESEKERNLFMYGNGTEQNPGQFNVQFADAQTWLDGLREENQQRNEKYRKDLNAAQRQIYDDAMAKREVDWQLRIGQHAAKRTLDMQMQTSKAAVAGALDDAAVVYTTPGVGDRAVGEYFDCVRKDLVLRGVPESAWGNEMRLAAHNLYVKAIDTRIQNELTKYSGRDDAAAVGKEWEQWRKDFANMGYFLGNEQMKAAYGSEGLTDVEKAQVDSKLIAGRETAIRSARNLFQANAEQMTDDYRNKMSEFSNDNNVANWAPTVRSWANDKKLERYNPELSARFRTWADNLEHGFPGGLGSANKYIDTPKALDNYLGEKLRTLTALRLQGGDSKENKDRIRLLQTELVTDARAAFAHNLISKGDYAKLNAEFQEEISGQTRLAMGLLCRSFGIDLKPGAMNKSGELTNRFAPDPYYYTPSLPGEDGVRITGDQFLELYEKVRSALSSENGYKDENYRPDTIQAIVDKIKIDFCKVHNWDKQLDMILDASKSVMTTGVNQAAKPTTKAVAAPAEAPEPSPRHASKEDALSNIPSQMRGYIRSYPQL